MVLATMKTSALMRVTGTLTAVWIMPRGELHLKRVVRVADSAPDQVMPVLA